MCPDLNLLIAGNTTARTRRFRKERPWLVALWTLCYLPLITLTVNQSLEKQHKDFSVVWKLHCHQLLLRAGAVPTCFLLCGKYGFRGKWSCRLTSCTAEYRLRRPQWDACALEWGAWQCTQRSCGLRDISHASKHRPNTTLYKTLSHPL